MTPSLTTFIFEVINFLVLVWLLSRLVYRPLKNSIEKRQEELTQRELAADKRFEDAKQREDEATQLRSELDELRANTLREAGEQAAEERARLIAQAREDAAAERARAKRVLSAEREAARAWVREVAVAHSAEVAGRMLMQLAPDAVEDALFDRLLEEVARQKDTITASLSSESGTAGADVEVIFSRMPAEPRVAELRQRLSELLGRAPVLTLREDANLGAGLVLRLGHRVLDASVAGQLEAFREQARDLLQSEVHVA